MVSCDSGFFQVANTLESGPKRGISGLEVEVSDKDGVVLAWILLLLSAFLVRSWCAEAIATSASSEAASSRSAVASTLASASASAGTVAASSTLLWLESSFSFLSWSGSLNPDLSAEDFLAGISDSSSGAGRIFVLEETDSSEVAVISVEALDRYEFSVVAEVFPNLVFPYLVRQALDDNVSRRLKTALWTLRTLLTLKTSELSTASLS